MIMQAGHLKVIIISLWNETWLHFEETWTPFTLGYFCGSGNFVNVASLFRYYLPVEKWGVFHSNKLDFPSLKDALCQVWLKLTLWL